jgi:hypothetical protein
MKPQSKVGMLLCAAVAAYLIVSSNALAHHGWTGYDANRTLTLTGSITESRYANPHGTIRLRASGDDGKTWLVVLAPTGRMNSRGLSEAMLQVGTTATVVGYPHKQNADELRAERITIDGKTIELR